MGYALCVLPGTALSCACSRLLRTTQMPFPSWAVAEAASASVTRACTASSACCARHSGASGASSGEATMTKRSAQPGMSASTFILARLSCRSVLITAPPCDVHADCTFHA